MGLLDFYNDPQQQAMLGLAGGLLSAGGPSSRPVGFGAALGQGLLTSQQAYGQARKDQYLTEQMRLQNLQQQAMVEKLRREAAGEQMLQQFVMGGGAPASTMSPGVSGTTAAWLDAPWAQSVPQAAPSGPPNYAALIAAGVAPERVKALMDDWRLRNPELKFEGGIPRDPRTGMPIAGVPAVPQTNQQGFSTTPRFNPATGQVEIGVTPGSMEAFRAQQDAANRSAAGMRFETIPINGRPTTMPADLASDVLRNAYAPPPVTASNLSTQVPPPMFPPQGGAPNAPAPAPAPAAASGRGSATAPAIESLQQEFATQRAIAMDPNASQMDREMAANRVREAGAELRRLGVQINDPAVYPSAPGPAARKPGQGETKDEEQARADASKRRELEAQSAKQRMDDLVKAADAQRGVLSTLDTLEAVINRPDGVMGTGLADRTMMVAHQYGYQTPASINTARVRELGNALILARGSLGAGVSNKDAEIYEKAAGSFQNAKSVKDMLDAVNVMRDIAQRQFSTTNEQITRFRDSGQLTEYREPIPKVPSSVGPATPQNPAVQRDRRAILQQYGIKR